MKLNIELIKASEIKHYKKNNKKHSDRQIRLIANSIRDFGFNSPILVDSNNVLIAGHARVEACKLLNIKEIPCIKKDDLTDEQIKAYRIADNKLSDLGEYDLENIDAEIADLLDADFDLAEYGLDDLLPVEDIEVIEDEAPEPPVNPVSELGDIWLLGKHRVLCGDSTLESSYIDLMQGKKAELLLTDPPYGIDYGNQLIKGEDFKDKTNKHGWRNFGNPSWDESKPELETFDLIRLQAENSIIWGGNYFTKELPASMGWLIWDKGQRGFSLADGEMAWTSFDNALRIKSLARATANQEDKFHPTQKPIEIIKWCLDYADRHSKIKVSLIADPFLGSGSTLIACEQLDRICYGIELEPKYVDVIINRWQNLTGQDAIHEKTGKTYKELKDVKGL